MAIPESFIAYFKETHWDPHAEREGAYLVF
jgi:hypothetical protein